ncbi:hypothetical protein BGP_4773 [Beggiatoa sp. PS]|nr:hypothetical protein BGP_4773 [Beggiatoa sp. PS]
MALDQNNTVQMYCLAGSFQCELDFDIINYRKQAVTQNQPLGNSHFYTKIEAMVGLRREPKPRGRRPKSKKITHLKITSIKENCHFDI